VPVRLPQLALIPPVMPASSPGDRPPFADTALAEEFCERMRIGMNRKRIKRSGDYGCNVLTRWQNGLVNYHQIKSLRACNAIYTPINWL